MTKKKNRNQRLEDSLSEAINPKPMTDRLNSVQSLLDPYRPATGNLPANDLDIHIAKDEIWLSKDDAVLDINIAKKKDLDSQISKKTGKWTKYDNARSTSSVFIRAASELVNEIKHFNVENKFDMKEFFELAARSFIDGFGYPNAEGLAIDIALDDRRLKILYKTDISIINLFREYNKIFNAQTDWKPKDDAVGVKYNDFDLRVIEIGIIQTQSNIH